MKKILIVAAILIGLWFGRYPIVAYALQRDEVITVTRTERVAAASGTSSKYLVWTDKGVFENVDSVWFLKFNSSDLQGALTTGSTFTVKATGLRLGLFSWYPNIIKIEE